MNELPTGWVNAQLGDLVTHIVGGGTPSKANTSYFQGTIPFMTVKDMHSRFIEDTQDHITQEALDDSASTMIPADTLIVASRMSLGKIARLKQAAAINQDLKALFLPQGIVKTYVEYAWRANESHIQAMGTGTTVKGIRLEDIRCLQVPLAPSAEQTRIADQLDTLLARINTCHQHLNTIPALLKRFRQAVLAAATSGRLTEDYRKSSAATVASGMPADWTESNIQTIATDLRYGTSKKCDYSKSGVGVLRIPNIADHGRIDVRDLKSAQFEEKEIEKLALDVGDLLVIRSNGSVELVGKTSIVTEKEAGLLFAGYLMRLRVNAELALPAFVRLCLAAPLQRKYIELTAKSTSGVNNLNAQELRALPLWLPKPDEQVEIVRRVDLLFKLADRIEARFKTACLQAQRLTPLMLAHAFRGDLVPQDPNDESASELLIKIKSAQEQYRGKQKTQKGKKISATIQFKNIGVASQKISTSAKYKISTGVGVAKLSESGRGDLSKLSPDQLQNLPDVYSQRAKNTNKSRFDKDVKGQPYLANHLRRMGSPVEVQLLFKASELPASDFYKQLAWEVAHGHVKDNTTTLEPGHAAG